MTLTFISHFDNGRLRTILETSRLVPAFITETDEEKVEDCTFASGLMGALNMGVDAPPTRAEREILRRLSGDLVGGAGLDDLNVALEARYGVTMFRPRDWREEELLDWLEFKGGVVAQIVYRSLGEPWIRWDRRFANRDDGGYHAVYLDHYAPAEGVFVMDPLGRGDYSGEYIPVANVIRALEAYRRRLGREGYSIALAPDGEIQVPRVPDLPAAPSVSEDLMFQLAPATTHRDAVLKPGTILYRDAGLTVRHSAVAKSTPLGFVGSTATAHVVANKGSTNYVRRSDVSKIIVNDRRFE